MATRWDAILSLPVQNPPSLEFSASDLAWSRVEGWRETVDRVALIPFSRIDDFLKGESANKECPTKFYVEARRKRDPDKVKLKVDGILEYILYWCSFGPDDHRKGGDVRPSRKYASNKKTPAGRPSTKRGCICHFIIKRLVALPSAALIVYNQEKHVDKKGLPCHGLQDKLAAGTRAMLAPYISDELHLQISSLIHVGVPVETIMQKHLESVEKQGGPCNRDDNLSHRFVRRLERSIRRSVYDLDDNDDISLKLWINGHQNHIFFHEDFSDSTPFVLGIQTEWQLQQMIRFGNHRMMAHNMGFGNNKFAYPIQSLLVFDSNNKAIPVAWIITSRFSSGESDKWLRALYERVRSKDTTWKLAGFLIDDPSTDILAIREVFQCSVLISIWHLRHSWHKNLVSKCPKLASIEISRRLGSAIYRICREDANFDLFEYIMEDFIDCSEFLDYFKAVWFSRIGPWMTVLKSLPLASQESCSAMECYHHQLKLRLLNEKDETVYKRTDWLVNKLVTKVHSYYWLDEYEGKNNFSRYQRDEWKSGLTPWRLASQIPDSSVIADTQFAKVINESNKEEAHIVWNPGSEFAICECKWSMMGYLCEHTIKAATVYRKRGLIMPSLSLLQYNQTLTNIFHCPPHDSLFRDHAVSLAVCIQVQLNKIIDKYSCSSSLPTHIEQSAANSGSLNFIPNYTDVVQYNRNQNGDHGRQKKQRK